MDRTTRRGFLAVAGVGAVAGAAAIAVPGVAGASESDTLPSGAEGAMAAYIHDVKKGEVVVMDEGREVIVTDKVLVARLARAFAKAGRA